MSHEPVTLRNFQPSDHATLKQWAANIGSDAYMSRITPKGSSAFAHDPAKGIFWFVIQAGGRDIGTLWLEPDPQEEEAILGILLGEESILGRGVGHRAILLACEHLRRSSRYNRILLNVKQSNARAIACYMKCGFSKIRSFVKVTDTGEQIPALQMQKIVR